ncbi:MAG: cytochrome c peroxidase [Verrucomicrobiota bacterium]
MNSYHFRIAIGIAIAAVCAFLPIINLNGSISRTEPSEDIRSRFSTPDTFDIEYPNDAEPSESLVELGRTLFFDTRLSRSQSQSCATCHDPNRGFSDGLQISVGDKGNPLNRHTPNIYNLAWNESFLWDGRSQSLEQQALMPIQSPEEMDLDLDTLIQRLSGVPAYREAFSQAFGSEEIDSSKIAQAIAAFERTLIVDDTPFDKYLQGDTLAISPEAKRGMVLFAEKAKCILCHDGPNLTDNSFHNIGLIGSDLGRAAHINDPTLRGAFKVPGLRNLSLTAPYMHDGSLATLEEVIEFYNRGGDDAENKSKLIQALNLSDLEKRDLLAFLETLNQPLKIEPPKNLFGDSD